MRTAIIILSLLLGGCTLLLLQGCSGIKALEVLTQEVERQPLNVDADEILVMEDIEWYIITEENYKEIFEELKKNKKDPVIFGVTDDGYETLSVNFANIRNYIIMNRNVIKLYKDYYEGEEDVKQD
tara:strand:+ start:1102 stop:1479 length:378 start_codon:yes stop_codon:yes gene_type:complete